MGDEASHDNHLAPAADHDVPAGVGANELREPPRGRLTPRPSFLENLASSREKQFMLGRRNSSEIDRYFVCQYLVMDWEGPFGLTG